MAVETPERETQLPAEAAGLIEGSPGTRDMAPIVIVGGLKSDRTPGFIYSPLMGHFPRSEEEDFLRILEGGLASFEDMSKHINEGVEAAYEKYEEPVVLGSQSLGGLFATKAALKHPEKVAAVVCLAGAQAGVKGEKPAAWLLRHVLGNPITADDLQEDSTLMMEHKEEIASEWPADTPLHLISPTTDMLIPIQQGLKLEVPEGRELEKRVIVPRLVLDRVSRWGLRIPDDAELIQNSLWHADHFNIGTIPAVISYVRRVRRQAVARTEEVANTASPLLAEPLTAVA